MGRTSLCARSVRVVYVRVACVSRTVYFLIFLPECFSRFPDREFAHERNSWGSPWEELQHGSTLVLLQAALRIWPCNFYRKCIANDPKLRLQSLHCCCTCSSPSTGGAALFWRAACFLHSPFGLPLAAGRAICATGAVVCALCCVIVCNFDIPIGCLRWRRSS